MELVLLRFHPLEEAAHAAPLTTPFDHRLLVRLRKLIERDGHRDLFRPAKLFQFLHGPLVLRLGPGLDRAVFQRQTGIRNNEIEVEPDRVSKALAGRTRAVWIIETEEPRLGSRVNSVVILAFEAF